MATPIDAADLAVCLAVLEQLQHVAPDDPAFLAVEKAAAHLRKRAKIKRKRARDRAAKTADRAALAATGMFRAKSRTAAEPPETLRGTDLPACGAESLSPSQHINECPCNKHSGDDSGASTGTLARDRACYICKQPYRVVDAFYHRLCPACAAVNAAKRAPMADLRGRSALLTGGRIKIGFRAALMLLRNGASVTVTTRFPRDAARRFAREADFGEWAAHVRIVGLDLLRLDDVQRFIDGCLAANAPFDILINNAAQTVRRPSAWYREVVAAESQPLAAHEQPLIAATFAPAHTAAALPHPSPIVGSIVGPIAEPAALACAHFFPVGARDHEGQPLDLRPRNSWVETLAEVDPVEVVETAIVNQIAPFLFASRLKPLMLASPFADRYIVNVSAMEGKFDYGNKTANHPHTNMAKAALNMLTRTAAADYAASGIFMTSVDTGWITEENPAPIKARVEAQGFRPPLDVVDGAARVVDPIFRGVAGERMVGCFLKDFRPVSW